MFCNKCKRMKRFKFRSSTLLKTNWLLPLSYSAMHSYICIFYQSCFLFADELAILADIKSFRSGCLTSRTGPRLPLVLPLTPAKHNHHYCCCTDKFPQKGRKIIVDQSLFTMTVSPVLDEGKTPHSNGFVSLWT